MAKEIRYWRVPTTRQGKNKYKAAIGVSRQAEGKERVRNRNWSVPASRQENNECIFATGVYIGESAGKKTSVRPLLECHVESGGKQEV